MSDGNSSAEDAAEIGESVRMQAYAELQDHAFAELEQDWQDNTNNA